jgi:hypothetical protein
LTLEVAAFSLPAMNWQGQPPPEDLLLQTSLTATREGGGRPPVFQYLDLELHGLGVERPARCLEEASPTLITYDSPLGTASKVRLTVRGMRVADPSARVLHIGFPKTVRALFDRWEREVLLSPAEAQPVVAHAHELWSHRLGSETELRIVGLLLEIEDIGRVDWTEDPDSPWSIEIDFGIRRFGGVANLADYLRIRYPEPG